MEQLEDFQKRIYNTYLKTSRKGLGIKFRKNFDNISEYHVLNLKKLSSFFKKYPHINVDEFFDAPTSVYENEPYPQLSFFNSRSAIRCYSLYKKKIEDQNPEQQSESIKNSLIFIGSFCIQNNIDISEYLNHKTGCITSWLEHYRQRKINPYSLMEIGDIISNIDKHQEDELCLFSENLKEKIHLYKIRYRKSKKTMDLVKSGTNKISFFIKKRLQK
jgi:hypothetical protein